MRYVIILLITVWASTIPLAAQQRGSVSLQTALSDSTFLNLHMTYDCSGKPVVVLKSAYMSYRGTLKRTSVECKDLKYKFDETAGGTAFQFSLNFTHNSRRYRAHGSYTAQPDAMPDCSLRCIPLRLSDKTLREGEYQN